jgi:cyanophycin synthetase
MRVIRLRALDGPNVFTADPALVMTIEAEKAGGEEIESKVGERLAGLAPHDPPGEDERHPLASLVARTARALVVAAGAGGRSWAVAPDEGGRMAVAVTYTSEEAARFVMPAAVRLVERAARGEPDDAAAAVNEARRIVEETALGPSTRAIVDAAAARGIPWRRLGRGSLVQLGYGRHRKFVLAAQSDLTRAIGVDIAADKLLTKQLLDDAAIPVPRGTVVRTAEEAVLALETLRVPVAVKPFDGRQGQGVSLNLETPEQVAEGFRVAREYSREVLVEETLQGNDFRALVVGGRLVAAAERVPAHVVGDGRRTIAELVETENRNPLRGEGHGRALTRLELDEIALAYLSRCGFEPESVPPDSETVYLRENANLSKGGTAVDVTDRVHPSVRETCERVARIVGLDICGVDLIADDMSEPLGDRAGIIEVNAAPGLRMHLHPSAGTPRDVGRAIVDMLYPEGDGRVPIVAVTGTNGKTTVTRMIAHAFARRGDVVGVTTTDGIWIAGRELAKGDLTGPHSARMVLSEPTLDVAVLETARGGIVRRGLGWDWCDVAVITNVQADHIGQDGITSVDDLLRVKRIVADRVRAGGTVVLNADDERLARIAADARVTSGSRRVALFSLDAGSPLVARHVEAGGAAFVREGEWLVERVRDASTRLVRTIALPAALGGRAAYQVANALAAAAACRARGLEPAAVADALASFGSDGQNPGRASLYRVGETWLMLDYGHNPDAFEAVGAVAAAWPGTRVGVVGLPGDRDDSVVVEAARAASRGFDRIVVREDRDRRGREPGEVPELVRGEIARVRPHLPVAVVPDEGEAVARAIADAGSDGLVVWFYEKLAAAEQILGALGAAPANHDGRLALAGASLEENERRIRRDGE